jgi:hypothetical protein
MRTPTALVLGLLLAVTVTGCGTSSNTPGVATAGSGAAASGGATSVLTEQEKALRFGQCMRDNGVPDFPDPKVNENGGMSLDAPEGVDPKKVDAAMQRCKQYLPNGGEPTKADPQVLEQLRVFSQCMRDNGFPNFPDPTDQGLQIDNNALGISGPDDPRFSAAQKTCEQHMPAPPSGGPSPVTNIEGDR